MTQHTPGPWRLHLVDDTTIVDARGRFIASVCGGDDDIGEADYNNPDEWPVMEANARLIAAAPDLYKQAQWNRLGRDLVDRLLADAGFGEDSSVRHTLAMMNFDALAKIEGQS